METPYIFIGVIVAISLLVCIVIWIVWRLKFKKDRVKPKAETNEEVDSAETFNARGNLYAHQKKYEEAKEQYQKALEIDPEFAKVHNNLGNVYFKQNLFEEAEWKYKKALELAPDYCDAHFNLGLLFNRQEKWNDAIWKFHQVLQLIPKDELAKKYIESIKKKIDAKGVSSKL
jgi:tetratricopeptide (TPR) repeat protein